MDNNNNLNRAIAIMKGLAEMYSRNADTVADNTCDFCLASAYKSAMMILRAAINGDDRILAEYEEDLKA